MILALLESADEGDLRKVFNWQARMGLGPKFGSRPIGWYQAHHCSVSDWLRWRAIAACPDGVVDPARCKLTIESGYVVLYAPNPLRRGQQRVLLGSVWEVYEAAHRCSCGGSREDLEAHARAVQHHGGDK